MAVTFTSRQEDHTTDVFTSCPMLSNAISDFFEPFDTICEEDSSLPLPNLTLGASDHPTLLAKLPLRSTQSCMDLWRSSHDLFQPTSLMEWPSFPIFQYEDVDIALHGLVTSEPYLTSETLHNTGPLIGPTFTNAYPLFQEGFNIFPPIDPYSWLVMDSIMFESVDGVDENPVGDSFVPMNAHIKTGFPDIHPVISAVATHIAIEPSSTNESMTADSTISQQERTYFDELLDVHDDTEVVLDAAIEGSGKDHFDLDAVDFAQNTSHRDHPSRSSPNTTFYPDSTQKDDTNGPTQPDLSRPDLGNVEEITINDSIPDTLDAFIVNPQDLHIEKATMYQSTGITSSTKKRGRNFMESGDFGVTPKSRGGRTRAESFGCTGVTVAQDLKSSSFIDIDDILNVKDNEEIEFIDLTGVDSVENAYIEENGKRQKL